MSIAGRLPRADLWARALCSCALLVGSGCAEFEDPVVDDLGSAPRCAFYETWEGEWAAQEADLVLAVSTLRGLGGRCGDTDFAANAPAVTHAPALRCAAREHAAFMGREGALGHVGSEGRDTATRIYDAGYEGIPRGELVARDYEDPERLIAAWLEDPQQCAALFDRQLDEVGAGLFRRGPGERPYWVLTLGTRRIE